MHCDNHSFNESYWGKSLQFCLHGNWPLVSRNSIIDNWTMAWKFWKCWKSCLERYNRWYRVCHSIRWKSFSIKNKYSVATLSFLHHCPKCSNVPFEGVPGGSVDKGSACKAGDTGDMGLIPVLRRSPGGGLATHSSILAWRTPRTEGAGGPQSVGSQRVRHDWSDWACMQIDVKDTLSDL